MILNKTLPFAYLGFNDNRAWEILCYNFGDVKKVINEEIAHGTITCNGTELVSSDYVFASCLNMPARQLSDATTQARVYAAAQSFKVEIEFDSSTPFSNVSGDVIQISQYSSSITKTDLLTVAKENVELDGENKYIATVQATNTCQYLTVMVNANNDVSASWKILPISGNYQPVGILQKQCNVVTSISTYLKNNSLIEDLRQLTYFPLTTFPHAMCDGCSSLQYVTIPNTVTYIGNYVFRLTKLITLDLPNSVTTIVVDPFDGVGNLVSVKLSNNLTKMPSFASCSSLESDIVIPPLVTTTPSQVIAATKVSKIVFHENITSIGTYSFQYMKSDHLDIYVYATTPPTLGGGSFNGTSSYTIYVPANTVDTYKAASGWSTYANHIEAIVEE